MPEITPKDYQNAASDAFSLTGKKYSDLSPEQQAALANDIALMAQFQSSIGNAAVNNPYADPANVLSQLSPLTGQPLDPAMILNLAAGRPALWSPVPVGSAGDTSPNSIAAWTSSPFTKFLLNCQDLATSLRNQDEELAMLGVLMNAVQWQLGVDLGQVKYNEKKTQADMYNNMMISTIVFGAVSASLQVVSFGFSMKAASYAGDASTKMEFKEWSAAATFAGGMAESINRFGQAAQSGIQAGATMTQADQEKTEQLLNTLMQILNKTQDIISQADQDVRQNLQQLLQMMADAMSQMTRGIGIGVRG
jgi:hypothetical protein